MPRLSRVIPNGVCGVRNLSAAEMSPNVGIFRQSRMGEHSFSGLRHMIEALGKRRGLVYLAIVMSP